MATQKQIEANRKNALKGGRKPGVPTLEREKARQYIAERIGEYMPAIFDVLIKKAVGEEDIAAIRELFDRGFGRAAQSVEMTVKDDATTSLSPEEAKIIRELETKLSKGDRK